MRKEPGASRTLKRISTGGLVLALAALFGLPNVAFAAPTTVSSDGANPATITITSDGSDNAVTVGTTALFVNVSDTQETVTPGAGCVVNPANPSGARCAIPSNGLVVINVSLGAGNDSLQASGTDAPMVVNGGDGNDILNGGQQDDVVNGGNGNDTLDGKGGGDDLNGGADIDTTSYVSAFDRNVSIDGVANDGQAGEGDDVDTENITTAGGDDTLTGDANANVLNGGGGGDTLNGAGGDDILIGGSGADDLNGGGGTDSVSYNPESRDVSVTAGIGANDDGVIDVDPGTVGDQSEGDTVAADVESIAGGGGDDILVGGVGAGTVAGNGGNDVLSGGDDSDADVISGGSGIDTVTYAERTAAVNVSLDGVADDGEGAEGDNVLANVENIIGGDGGDTLVGDDSVNRLEGGPGADTLNGGANNDVLIGGPGGDALNGGAGTGDRADYSAEVADLTITIDGAANDAGQGDNVGTSTENVTGGSGNDTITGSDAANNLNGGPGNDTLNGGLGTDTLNGAGGDDTLNGQAGADSMNGGLGGDVINGGGGGGDTTTYAGRLTGVTVTINSVVGDGEAGEGDNVMISTERVTGTSHADDIRGETGPAGSNPNVLNGGLGNDQLRGGDGNDTVNGGGGDDLVIGNAGRDSLVGGSGDDTLHGNVGEATPAKDSLNCGPGSDTFSADPIDFVSASCNP